MPYDPTYHVPWRVDRMWRAVRAEKPDVLQVSSPFLPALVAAGLREVPVRTYVYHSDPIGCYVEYGLRHRLPPRGASVALEPFWFWMRSISTMCDATIVAGRWLAQVLERHRCPRVHTIPFGIEHSDFAPSKRNDPLRRKLLGRYADDSDAKLLLVAGRLAVDKRQHLLVDAALRLSERRAIALVVLGDGPERERLEHRASRLAQATFLPFTKDRAEYASLLASCDVLLHASRCETYGFLLAEALASGTPVVIADAGGASAMVTPSCSERYSVFGDAGDVVAAAERLFARDRDSLSRGAVEAARAQPSADDHFTGLFDLYASLLQRKSE